MKKIFAIAMLVLLLFNLWGYQVLFQYFIYRSDNLVTAQINNNQYRPADLVEVKIPVHLNIQDWDDFEPISGQVKVQDNCYNYAELRMTRDTMYLMCIPNNDKARIVHANIVYAKQVNDIPSGKKPNLPIVKNTIGEFECNYYMTRHVLIATEEKKAGHSYAFADVVKTSIDFQGQPPEAFNSFLT